MHDPLAGGHAFTSVETVIGSCALVWSADGIAGVCLPESSESRLMHAIQQRFPGAVRQRPPAAVLVAADGIASLLAGGNPNLSSIALDLSGVPEFHRRVYDVARAIPRGSTLTYGEVATRLGEPGAARAVGQALGRNPVPVIVPCHRVLASGGAAGGFSAPGGVHTKQRLLAIEGVEMAVQPGLFDTPR